MSRLSTPVSAGTAARVRRCLAELSALNPQAVQLARYAALAVRIDASLLRRLRLDLLPGAPSSTEADLWFSDLAESRDAEALVLDTDVAQLLRDELVRERLPDGRAALVAAYALLREQHAAWPAALRLEEALVYRALHGEGAAATAPDADGAIGVSGVAGADADFDELLAPALAAMASSDPLRGAEVSRWVLRAMPRLPDAARTSDAASALAVAAAAHLGASSDTLAALADRALPTDLRWLLPQLDDRDPVELVCAAGDRSLLLRMPAADEPAGLRIRLPATQPLLVELRTLTPRGEHWRTVPLTPGLPLGLPEDWQRVDLRGLTGEAWRIEAMPAAQDNRDRSNPPRRCYVIQGFGKKTDLRSGRVVDLDQSYQVIKAAVSDAGFVCERLDEVSGTSALPDLDVLRILQADLVIVDRTCNLPEVLYQLGVCHGLRRTGTVLVGDSSLRQRWSQVELNSLHYDGEMRVGNDSAQAFTVSLQRRLETTLTSDPIDSPVFAVLPELIRTSGSQPEVQARHLPRCYAVMGFGQNTDLATGRTLDLDRSYRQIIQPAAHDAGCQPMRADELPGEAPSLETQHLRALWESEIVVADLSTAHPDAAYALGVRHALRPGGTMVIAEQGFAWGFDAQRWRLMRYEHLGGTIDVDEGLKLKGLLAAAIDAQLDQPAVDSPVYRSLERDLWPGFAALRPRPPKPALDAPVVYIIHLSENRVRAETLAQVLERDGVRVWRDTQELKSGDNRERALADVIDRVDYVIVLQTRELMSRDEGYAFHEIALALERQRKMPANRPFVLPVCADGAMPIKMLSDLHSVFLDQEGAIERLVQVMGADQRQRQSARNSA